jgi:hypothetical protein
MDQRAKLRPIAPASLGDADGSRLSRDDGTKPIPAFEGRLTERSQFPFRQSDGTKPIPVSSARRNEANSCFVWPTERSQSRGRATERSHFVFRMADGTKPISRPRDGTKPFPGHATEQTQFRGHATERTQFPFRATERSQFPDWNPLQFAIRLVERSTWRINWWRGILGRASLF